MSPFVLTMVAGTLKLNKMLHRTFSLTESGLLMMELGALDEISMVCLMHSNKLSHQRLNRGLNIPLPPSPSMTKSI